jgi:tetratricopeptide (TPR) repeat protein
VTGFVFVSYSRGDSTYVTRLVTSLQQAGLPMWLDTDEIEYGDRWEQVLRDRVDSCAVLLVVMTPAAEASEHVGNELHRARDAGKPILPLLLSGRPFFALGASQHFDARDGALPDDRFVRRLTDLISASPDRAAVPAGGVPVKQLVAGDPPGQAVAWQDRPSLVQGLFRAAGADRTAVVCSQAGQRGVGKTQLAAAYARLRIQQGWPVVVWANAETEAGIVAALDELAITVGVRRSGADPQQAARAGLRWLRRHPGPCLLVYDNAVDQNLIRTWTPPLGQVQTIVTTTHRDLGGLGEMVDVARFSEDEAVDYLRRRTKVDDRVGATELAEHLGRLPLALAQAGAVIGADLRYHQYRRYLHALQRTPAATLLPRTVVEPYPLGLAEAVLLSLDDLAGVDPGGRARRLLDQLAVLASTGADTILLEHLVHPRRSGAVAGGDDGEPGEADELVALLAGRSLTVSTRGADRTVVHRLVQRVVRERCQQTGTLDRVVTEAADALREAAGQIGASWSTRALIGQYATHTATLTTHSGSGTTRRRLLTLRLWMVHWLRGVHNYSTAAALGAGLLADCEDIVGSDSSTTMTTRHNLAQVYQAMGRLDEAIELFTRTLADQERMLGRDHPDTLGSRNNLAAAYQAVGRLDEAIGLFTRTLADRERVLGPDHPYTLASRNFLAEAYRAVGRLNDAIELYTRTLADRERVLGPDHPDTLGSRNNLAAAYQAVGRLNDAIELYTRTVADRERVLGPDHPDTLASRNNLAYAYQAVGRLDEAIELDARTLADRERVLGPDHPGTLASRHHLAYAYRAMGRLDEAIELYTRTVADHERVLGPHHPRTLTVRNNLAAAYRAAGRLDEAIQLHACTLADRERVLGPDHPDTSTSRHHLAGAYRVVGRLDEAIELYRRTVADYVRVLGPDHPYTLTSRNNLAAAYRVAGRIDEADALSDQP